MDLIECNEEAFLQRIFRLCAGVYEEFIQILFTWLTRKGKLERALESRWTSQAAKMLNIEKALRQRLHYKSIHSSSINDSAERVLNEEEISVSGDIRDEMKTTIERALKRMDAYDELIEKVEEIRNTRYDSDNSNHKDLLSQLWLLIHPDIPLTSMISSQWKHIGFQGNDPSTDFRGMGILSLHQMIYFAKNHLEILKNMLSVCNHPTIGFPWATAGITFTALTRDLLQNGYLKRHFYNTLDHCETIEDFHRAYVRIFILYMEYYRRWNPSTMMEFNTIRYKFESSLKTELLKDEANLNEITLEDLI